MGIKVITSAADLLTAAEMRLQCRIDGTDSDGLLATALAGAAAYAQHYTGASLGQQTLELAIDQFPAGPIQLPQGPVASITSLKYINTSGTETTLSASLYTLDDYSTPQWCVQAYATDWPDTQDVANAVKVRYVAGTAAAGAVKQAILLLVAHYYRYPEGVSEGAPKEVPLGVHALLDTVKVWSM
jgi:uncharacterized phiE125 gp8 family phage protein